MKAFWISAASLAFLLAACGEAPRPAATADKAAKPADQTCCVFGKQGQDEDAFPHLGDRVFFAFDQAGLDEISRRQVAKWVEYLRKSPDDKLFLEGHADERGTREYNLALGERRASAVRDFMVGQGIDPSRLAVTSYGKERPAVAGSDESAWAQNRRVVAELR